MESRLNVLQDFHCGSSGSKAVGTGNVRIASLGLAVIVLQLNTLLVEGLLCDLEVKVQEL
jgi:hypothetical protein